MIKNLSPLTKNIRIRTDSISKSQEKQKFSRKLLNQPYRTNITNEMLNISQLEHSSQVYGLEKLKVSQMQRGSSPFANNRDKKSLVISSNKENNLAKSLVSNNLKLEKNSNIIESTESKKKLSIIQLLQSRPLKQVEEQELPTPRELNKKRNQTKINYNKGQNGYYNFMRFSEADLNQNMEIFTKQTNFDRKQQRILKQFQIINQFSLNLGKFSKKIDCETQTNYTSIEDKYFNQYVKYRFLKEKNYKAIEERESKIKKVLYTINDFDQNYQELAKFMSEGPANEREKRVRELSQELSRQQFQITETFDKISNLAKGFQKTVEKNIHSIRNKKSMLINSISHLVESTLFLTRKRNPEEMQKLTRILSRVKNQVSVLNKFMIQTQNYGVDMFKQYNRQISNLHKEYESLKKNTLQNRVLLFNCVKQIEKFPTLMAMLFGFDKEPEVCDKFCDIKQITQNQVDEYMTTKCEECYNMKKKVKLIQFHNQKIKPILKSLQWLLEDRSKPSCCLSMI